MSLFQILALVGIAFMIVILYSIGKGLGSIDSYLTYHIPTKENIEIIEKRLDEIERDLLGIRFNVPFVTKEDMELIRDMEIDMEMTGTHFEKEWKSETSVALADIKNLLEEIRDSLKK